MSTRIVNQPNSPVKPVTPCRKRADKSDPKHERPTTRHLCRTTAYPRYCTKHDHLYYPCLCGCRPDDCPMCLDEEWAEWEKTLDREVAQEARQP